MQAGELEFESRDINPFLFLNNPKLPEMDSNRHWEILYVEFSNFKLFKNKKRIDDPGFEPLLTRLQCSRLYHWDASTEWSTWGLKTSTL